MPELPEVETIRRQLAPHLEGRTIVDVEILDFRWTRPERPEEVERQLRGAVVLGLERFGKYLDWELSGERHLLMRLSELTKTHVSHAERNIPHSWLVRLTDDALFGCPYLMASDVGTIGLTDAEAARLRLYLEKGGFLWVDDFWGDAAWEQWSREFAKVMPPPDYIIEDVPLTDPIFHSMFEVKRVPQVSNIRFWRATGGASTSERGAESAVTHFRAVRDKHHHIIAVMTHNTDISDSWERETDDPGFFQQFAPDGYALGIDVVLYALTH